MGLASTSTMRSSSERPCGVATVASHCTLPSRSATASSLPLAKPAYTTPAASTGAPMPRSVSAGTGRSTTHRRAPSCCSKPYNLPSPAVSEGVVVVRAPHRRTVLLREREHLAVARAEQQGLARGGDAAAHVAAQAPLPEEAPLACIVGAQDIVAVHQIQHAVRHHGPKFALRRVLPWTDRPRPCGLHVHLFGEGRQRRRSTAFRHR